MKFETGLIESLLNLGGYNLTQEEISKVIGIKSRNRLSQIKITNSIKYTYLKRLLILMDFGLSAEIKELKKTSLAFDCYRVNGKIVVFYIKGDKDIAFNIKYHTLYTLKKNDEGLFSFKKTENNQDIVPSESNKESDLIKTFKTKTILDELKRRTETRSF
jgi:transcriptional regulator with XRE-family HTH domain